MTLQNFYFVGGIILAASAIFTIGYNIGDNSEDEIQSQLEISQEQVRSYKSLEEFEISSQLEELKKLTAQLSENAGGLRELQELRERTSDLYSQLEITKNRLSSTKSNLEQSQSELKLSNQKAKKIEAKLSTEIETLKKAIAIAEGENEIIILEKGQAKTLWNGQATVGVNYVFSSSA